MSNLQIHIKNYLEYCIAQKRLDEKTVKAYRIDLRQFSEWVSTTEAAEISANIIEAYLTELHQQYTPKTVKRKIASLKAFFHYLEYKEIIDKNPFNKLHIKFRDSCQKQSHYLPLKYYLIQFICNTAMPQTMEKKEFYFEISLSWKCFLQQELGYLNYVQCHIKILI